MAQINWQQQDPKRPHETIGVASEKIAYYVYDQGDGLFLATVRVRKGLGTTNLQIRDDGKNIDKAKTVCQNDFDSGSRP